MVTTCRTGHCVKQTKESCFAAAALFVSIALFLCGSQCAEAEAKGLARLFNPHMDVSYITADSWETLRAGLDEAACGLPSRINIMFSEDIWADMEADNFQLIGRYLSFRCGVDGYHSEWSLSDRTKALSLKDISYYPGWKIVHTVFNGYPESMLSQRELETLSVARETAALVEGKTDLEKERILHDALCDHVSYTIDETTNEDDTAVGAILNGEANCDGYSDAFYLLCRLAGLDAGYMGYDTYSREEGNDMNHIWNMVRIDDAWMMVDVTWDDCDGNETVYAYYNIGQDRAAWTHIWDDRYVTVPWLKETDATYRPEETHEYMIATLDDLRAAVSETVSGLKKSFTVLPDANMRIFFADENSVTGEMVREILRGAGIIGWKWMTLSGEKYRYYYDLEYYPEIVEAAENGRTLVRCATQQDIERYVREVMRDKPEHFVFRYEKGPLNERETEAMANVIYSMGCKHFARSFNDYGRVEISGIEYYDEFAICSQESEMRAYIRNCTDRWVPEFRVYLPRELYERLHSDKSSGWFAVLNEMSAPTVYAERVYTNDNTCMFAVIRSD